MCVVLRYTFMYKHSTHNAVVSTPTYVCITETHASTLVYELTVWVFLSKQQRISIHFYMDTIWLRETSTYEHTSGICRNSLMVLCTHVPYMTHDLVVNERAYITITHIHKNPMLVYIYVKYICTYICTYMFRYTFSWTYHPLSSRLLFSAYNIYNIQQQQQQ